MKNKFYSFAIIGLLSLNLGKMDLRANNASPEGRGFVREKIETKVENLKNSLAKLEKVKVTAKDATSITVDNNGTSVKVNITSTTNFKRKFWGKSSLGEISVNDIVTVFGKWSDDSKTVASARVIWDLSIQKRYGTFFGEIKSLTADGFVMTTIHRDDETVTIGTAKLKNRKEEVITKSDILVGHRVRVKGMWDSVNKTITEVKEVKDFSLPIKASPQPSP
jgi:hypothetical protein